MDHREVGRHWDANAATWTKLAREGYDVCRDYVNTPAFLAMLPEVAGLRGLDIGCGEGSNTRLVAARGAELTALDISPVFVHHAREAGGPPIRFLIASAVELPFADATFDFATAFMSFMDIGETDQILAEAYRVLRPGAFLQFSICHPCSDLPHRRKLRDEQGREYAYELGGYFTSPEVEVTQWLFSAAPPEARAGLRPFRTPVFRRTLSQWFNLIVDTGFVIEHLHEPCPDDEVVRLRPDLADMRIIPFFMIIRCRKPLLRLA